MKRNLRLILEGFLTAYGITASVNAPLYAYQYQEKTGFITDSVYSFLGEFSFMFLLVWLSVTLAFFYLEDKTSDEHRISKYILAGIFALTISIGRVIADHGTLNVLGTAVNAVTFILGTVGLFILFAKLISFFSNILKKKDLTGDPGFFEHRSWFKASLIIFLCYLPIVLLSFPGNLCYDSIGQIDMVLKLSEYSAHHPLAHTLLMGGLVKFGYDVCGSGKIGLFIYILLQTLMLSTALGATVFVLRKRGMKAGLLWALIIIYIITPVYSNITSTAIKDVPFISCYIGYFVCLCIALEDFENLNKKGFTVTFILLQVFTILFRNNGLYEVMITGIVVLIAIIARTGFKDAKKLFGWMLKGFLVSFVIALLINSGLKAATKAVPGGRGEALSLPFQISARYLQVYKDTLSDRDRASIEKVMGDVDNVAARYNPDLSDAVKALYDKNSSVRDTFDYLMVVVKMCFKHPGVCTDAILNHIYGWYTPLRSSAIRYEIYTMEDVRDLAPTGIFETFRKVLIFFYRFLDRISLLGLLQNVGFAVWAAAFLLRYCFINGYAQKNFTGFIFVPLIAALLICFDAPGFYTHTRYGFPILCTVPFLYGFLLTKREER